MVTADWITTVDVNLTLARVAIDMGYVRPTILDGVNGSVVIEGLRHPLLEAQDRKIPYVQHSVSIGANQAQGWLLYGLNASGKSSLMRATGLAVLLAQGGSFVPASKMILAPFASLHTRIINTDNLWMGLSSFAVEMSEMRDIFRDAGPRSLVLGDELCSGTETTSATALVAAGLKGLMKRGARFLFATHLHGLGEIPEVVSDKRLSIWHLHVEYDRLKDRLVYHRTLKPGSGSSLYGLEVAKAMRLPDDILEDAIQFRKRLAGQAELSESVGSSWNSAVVRRKCEHCGTMEADSLEVHHIKERRLANTRGRLTDGSDVHAVANLVVLCDACHDKIHANELVIGPLVQTSEGLERSTVVSESSPVAKEGRKSKWSEEQLRTIESVYRQYPTLKFGALSNMLLNKYEIEITSATLKKMLT
jgi:DNA mismatch repair protein MutS